MAEAESRGFWPSDDVVCAAHTCGDLPGFLTPTPNPDGVGCVVCGEPGDPVVQLDDVLDWFFGVLRAHWLRADDHLFHDNESSSGWALVDPVDAADLVWEIYGGSVDDALCVHLSQPGCLGEDQWFHPSRLWLADAELISYSWAEFRKWALGCPAGFDLVAASVTPGLFDLSNEQADGIHPTHMLSRLADLIDSHTGLTTVEDRTWHRAVVLEPGELPTPARLGSAPARYAAANRMSAKGVSMFYGAEDPATAVGEIRPRSGDRVVVGAWKPARPLRLVDLVDLPPEPSFLDWERASERAGLQSLGGFADDLRAPLLPGSDPSLGYRPTQAFTSYLQRHYRNLDGIMYRSSIDEKPCCVLFADNAACDPGSGAPVTLQLGSYTDSAAPR